MYVHPNDLVHPPASRILLAWCFTSLDGSSDDRVKFRSLAYSTDVWFGAFRDAELVADLGIYGDEGVGRFQAVETHPAYRRRGIATTLIRWAASHAFDRMAMRELVILAEPDTFIAEMYTSLGFLERERAAGVYHAAP